MNETDQNGYQQNNFQNGPQNDFQSGPQNDFQSGPQNGYQSGPQNGYQQSQYNGGYQQNGYQQSQFQNGYQQPTYAPGMKVNTVNKNIHIWVWCFLLGGLGLDRFMRGQVGLGICKLLFNWVTLGIWSLVDWIIAMVKGYGSAYGNEENFTFINGLYSK